MASSEREALRDLLLEPPDVPPGNHRLVPAGAECVLPLAVAETGQPLARPMHVGGGEVGDQLLVEARPVELHLAVGDALGEGLRLELDDVVPVRPELPRLPEG